MALVVAVQPNGEMLLYETWVYEQWRWGQLTDPLLTRGLDNAVEIEDWWGRQLRKLKDAYTRPRT